MGREKDFYVMMRSHFVALTLGCEYEKFSFLSKLFDTFMNWYVCHFLLNGNGMCAELYSPTANSIRIVSHSLNSLFTFLLCILHRLVMHTWNINAQSQACLESQKVFNQKSFNERKRKTNWPIIAKVLTLNSFKIFRAKKTRTEDEDNRKRSRNGKQGSIRPKELALPIGENEFNVAQHGHFNEKRWSKKKDQGEACCVWNCIIRCTTTSVAAHCN